MVAKYESDRSKSIEAVPAYRRQGTTKSTKHTGSKEVLKHDIHFVLFVLFVVATSLISS